MSSISYPDKNVWLGDFDTSSGATARRDGRPSANLISSISRTAHLNLAYLPAYPAIGKLARHALIVGQVPGGSGSGGAGTGPFFMTAVDIDTYATTNWGNLTTAVAPFGIETWSTAYYQYAAVVSPSGIQIVTVGNDGITIVIGSFIPRILVCSSIAFQNSYPAVATLASNGDFAVTDSNESYVVVFTLPKTPIHMTTDERGTIFALATDGTGFFVYRISHDIQLDVYSISSVIPLGSSVTAPTKIITHNNHVYILDGYNFCKFRTDGSYVGVYYVGSAYPDVYFDGHDFVFSGKSFNNGSANTCVQLVDPDTDLTRFIESGPPGIPHAVVGWGGGVSHIIQTDLGGASTTFRELSRRQPYGRFRSIYGLERPLDVEYGGSCQPNLLEIDIANASVQTTTNPGVLVGSYRFNLSNFSANRLLTKNWYASFVANVTGGSGSITLAVKDSTSTVFSSPSTVSTSSSTSTYTDMILTPLNNYTSGSSIILEFRIYVTSGVTAQIGRVQLECRWL